MSSIIKYNTRITQKSDITANWKSQPDFVPMQGEIIFYTDVNKIKIGDGMTSINELPFYLEESGLRKVFAIPSQSAVTLAWGASTYTTALISTNGPSGAAGGSYLVSCYAPGGSARTKVTRLMGSTDILYGILPQNTDDYVGGIVLFNNSNVSFFVNILVLTGTYPEIIEGNSGVSPYAYEADVPINSANVLNYAAPTGFGLGDTGIYLDDFNAVVKSGFYYTDANTKNRMQFCPEFGAVLVVNGNKVGRQYKLLLGQNYDIGLLCIYYTNDYGSTWTVEWINPPMIPGEEYRTTERWNGKPVYTQLVNFGTLPASGMKQKKITDVCTGLVECHSSCQSSTQTDKPYYAFEFLDQQVVSLLPAGYLRVTATQNLSAWTAYFYIKYTKN